MRLTSRTEKFALTLSLSLLMSLWMSQTKLMASELNQWDQNPETLILKGSPAEFDAVLVPVKNYQNYKTFELQNQEMKFKIGEIDASHGICADNPWVCRAFWFTLGLSAGGLAFSH